MKQPNTWNYISLSIVKVKEQEMNHLSKFNQILFASSLHASVTFLFPIIVMLLRVLCLWYSLKIFRLMIQARLIVVNFSYKRSFIVIVTMRTIESQNRARIRDVSRPWKPKRTSHSLTKFSLTKPLKAWIKLTK